MKVEQIFIDEHRVRTYIIENGATCSIVKSAPFCAFYITFLHAPVTLYPFFCCIFWKAKISFKVPQWVFGNLFYVIISLHIIPKSSSLCFHLLIFTLLSFIFALYECEKKKFTYSQVSFLYSKPQHFQQSTTIEYYKGAFLPPRPPFFLSWKETCIFFST